MTAWLHRALGHQQWTRHVVMPQWSRAHLTIVDCSCGNAWGRCTLTKPPASDATQRDGTGNPPAEDQQSETP
jgi:hypothetical protein